MNSLARVLIEPDSLRKDGPVDTIADQCATLLEQQEATWDLLRRGYESLATVETRTFEFDGFKIEVQFNPGRITSSAAKVDEKSIRERKCFLCVENLPDGQRGLRYEDDYLILGNPFPIFPSHFTIPHVTHRPQEILPSFATMLGLTRKLSPRYTLVYNGPRCGASAPDHLHLQAGTAGFMPFESEIVSLPRDRKEVLLEVDDLRAYFLSRYLRTVLVLEARTEKRMEQAFRLVHKTYSQMSGGTEEPMMNIIAIFRDGWYTLGIFTRSKHRPDRFFVEGDEKMLLSPAAVDMGGVMTMPVERDFRRISREDVIQVCEEVSLPAERFGRLTAALWLAFRGV